MSKLSDYSKFDHLDDSSEDEQDSHPNEQPASPAVARDIHEQDVATTRRDPHSGRYIFEYGGTKIYEWEQSLEGTYVPVYGCDGLRVQHYFCFPACIPQDSRLFSCTTLLFSEVNIYVTAPPGVKASQLVCNIQPHRLQLGIRGNDRLFIDEATFSLVETSESSWYMDEGGIVNVVLIKAHRAEMWESALKGQGVVNAFEKEEMKKSLLLERFGEENAGFDFRDAKFNGAVPDPRTFMGGVKYS